MADDAIVEHGFDTIQEQFNELRAIYTEMVAEGFIDNHRGDLDRKFDETEKKLIAARRGLGLVNTGFDKEQEREHKSKLMRYINIFRKELTDIMQEMGMSEKEMAYHNARIGLDREYGKPAEVFQQVPSDNKHPASFKDHMNQQRNTANPDEMSDYVKPKVKTGEKALKWYQKLFRR